MLLNTFELACVQALLADINIVRNPGFMQFCEWYRYASSKRIGGRTDDSIENKGSIAVSGHKTPRSANRTIEHCGPRRCRVGKNIVR